MMVPHCSMAAGVSYAAAPVVVSGFGRGLLLQPHHVETPMSSSSLGRPLTVDQVATDPNWHERALW